LDRGRKSKLKWGSVDANLLRLLGWFFFFLPSLLIFYIFGLLIFGVIPVDFIITLLK
jgi:hypothetical protein